MERLTILPESKSTLQPMLRWHLPEIAVICREALTNVYLTDSIIREKLLDPLPASRVYSRIAVVDGRIAGVCCGAEIPEIRMGGVRLLVVAPRYQKRGIGEQLLADFEATMSRRACIQRLVIAATPGNYLTPGIDETSGLGIRFAIKHGYKFIEMAETLSGEIVLEGDGARAKHLQNSGYIIRRIRSREGAAVLELSKSFDPCWEPEIRRALNNSPQTVQIGTLSKQIVGFCCMEANNVGSGAIGPLGVHQNHRQRGVATALLRAAVKDLLASGYKRFRIPWVNPELHPLLYRSFNASREGLFLIYGKRN